MSECGCKIVHAEYIGGGGMTEEHIEFCPLHAAAEKLREALEYVLDVRSISCAHTPDVDGGDYFKISCAKCKADAALAAGKGEA